MTSFKTFLITIMLLSMNLFAQSDLEIFGFYQVRFDDLNMKLKVTGDVPTPFGLQTVTFADQLIKYDSPYMQQADIFLRKELTSNFTAFMGFEFVNNFSTEDLWGGFKVDEAWLNYEYSAELNVKAGYFVPKFNYLNEIKNRMPAIPYIIRPLIYESSLKGVVNVSDFLPEKAFLQVYGRCFLGDLGLNYAVYAGQSETGFLNKNNEGSATSATDTSKFKLFGTRIGLNYGSLRIGLSASQDRDNLQASLGENVMRHRFGADLGFNFEGFFLDGEVIKVALDPKNTTEDLDKLFYYVTLEYDFNEQLFAYTSFSNMKDNATNLTINSLLLGGGYRVTNDLVFKVMYNKTIQKSQSSIPVLTNAKIDIDAYSVAISILF